MVAVPLDQATSLREPNVCSLMNNPEPKDEIILDTFKRDPEHFADALAKTLAQMRASGRYSEQEIQEGLATLLADLRQRAGSPLH